jgi:hypothetical protein
MNRRVVLAYVLGLSVVCAIVARADETAPAKPPTTSSVAEKKGLRVTVQLAKAAFGVDEDLALEVTFTNVSEKPFKTLDADWVERWRIIAAPDGGGGPWQAFFIGARRGVAGPAQALKPGESRTVAAKIDANAFEFRWIGESFAPVPPRKHLPAGHYALTVTFELGSTDDNSSTPYWSGKIDTGPMDLRIVPPGK